MELVAELLVDALFKPGVKLNPDHKPKYIHLLAYAASVSESGAKKGNCMFPSTKHFMVLFFILYIFRKLVMFLVFPSFANCRLQKGCLIF